MRRPIVTDGRGNPGILERSHPQGNHDEQLRGHHDSDPNRLLSWLANVLTKSGWGQTCQSEGKIPNGIPMIMQHNSTPLMTCPIAIRTLQGRTTRYCRSC